MFSMKIGLAAFDQPGQLNRPFNYPIRYIYIYFPASKVLASKSERSAQIDWRCTRCFICYSTSSGRWNAFVRTVTLFGSIPFYWRTSIHGMEQYSIRNKPLRSSRYPSCKLDSFPCSSLKSNRSISIFTTSLLVRRRWSSTRRSSLHDPRRRIDFVLFVSFWHVSPILLC